jgi:VWFA-related protein
VSRSARLWASVCCIVPVFAAPGMTTVALAQTATQPSAVQLVPRTKQQRERMENAANRVALTVQVTDAAGKPVTGLKAADFTVLDDHVLQPVAFLDKAQTPSAQLHVVLVLDAVNDGGSGVKHLEKELKKFLDLSKEPLGFQLSLVSLSEAGVAKTEPTNDRAVIAAELSQLVRRPHSRICDKYVSYQGETLGFGNCVFDHDNKSIDALIGLLGERQNRLQRTVLIWAGPGWPVIVRGSDIQKTYVEMLEDITEGLQQGPVTLDAISWGYFAEAEAFGQPIMSVTVKPASFKELASAITLPALALRGGGQAIAKLKNFPETLAALIADSAESYRLSFYPLRATTPAFHSIEVQVDRPGVTVRTLEAYYAQP